MPHVVGEPQGERLSVRASLCSEPGMLRKGPLFYLLSMHPTRQSCG